MAVERDSKATSVEWLLDIGFLLELLLLFIITKKNDDYGNKKE